MNDGEGLDRRGFLGVLGAGAATPMAMGAALPELDPMSLAPHLVNHMELESDVAEAMALRAREALSGPSALLIGSPNAGGAHVADAANFWVDWKFDGGGTVLHGAVGLACGHALAAIRSGRADFRRTAGCRFGGAWAHVFRRRRGAIFLVTKASMLPGSIGRLQIAKTA